MKKLTIALGIAVALTGSAFASNNGKTGTVSFVGKVTAPTCEFKAGSENQRVELPEVMTYELDNGNSLKKDFTIAFEGCPTSTKRTLALSFNSDRSDNGFLLNTVTQDGTNAALKLSNKDGDQIQVNKDGQNVSVAKSLANGGDVEFNFTAEYEKRDRSEETTAGAFEAQAQFTVEYQ